ncbi:hypothetical protein [Pannonibacter phragmitetus]|nr:hypothetical protein [Pannonibacter phragmitetus]
MFGARFFLRTGLSAPIEGKFVQTVKYFSKDQLYEDDSHVFAGAN